MMYNDCEDPQWFTSDHVGHHPKWFCMSRSLKGHEEVTMCVACVVELLEDSEQLQVKKKMILGQIVNILHSQKEQLMKVLSEDSRVAAHVALIILDLTLHEDETFCGLASEVLFSILMALQNEEILGCVVNQIATQAVKLCNYKKCLSMFNLLGKLQNNVPLLSTYVLQNNGSLVDLICAGIGYPDPKVQCSLTYICVELYKNAQGGVIPVQLSEQVAGHLLQTLSSANQTQELTINLLGLLKTMLEVPQLPEVFMNVGCKNTSAVQQPTTSYNFAGAIKRVLLSRVDVLQVAGVQCVVTLLRPLPGQNIHKLNSYTGVLLKEDIAEFLFEALNTTNDLLIGCIFTCLLLFTKSDLFFHKCHAVYGVESMVRSIEQVQKLKNTDLQTQGIKLLNHILANHSGKIRLFSGPGLLKQCIAVISSAVCHNNQTLALTATECLVQLFRKEYLTTPPPYNSFILTLQSLVTKFHEQPPMTCDPPIGTGQRSTECLSRTSSFEGTAVPRGKQERTLGHQQQKSARTQLWIAKLLAVTNKAISLVSEIGSDPIENEQSYAQPNTQANNGTDQKPSSAQDLLMVILTIVDETCIPAVLLNTAHLTDPTVLTSMYSVLKYVLQLSGDNSRAVAERMASLGFITHALQAKSTFSDKAVNCAADEYLTRLLEILVVSDAKFTNSDHNEEQIKQNLRQGIDQLHGNLDMVIQILEQNLTASESWSVPFSAVCVLYHSAVHCPQSISDDLLLPAVCGIIDHMGDIKTVKTLTKPLFRYLVYLYAKSTESEKEKGKVLHTNKSGAKLLEYIEGCGSPDDWYIPSQPLLHWCFSEETITDTCGKQVLSGVLCGKAHSSYCELVQTMAAVNSNLVKVLMMLVTCEQNEELCDQAFRMLNQLVNPKIWPDVSLEVQVLLKSYLPEFTHRGFLHTEHKNKDMTVCLLLRLMTQLRMRTLEEPFTTLDVKLLLQVLKWLSKHTEGRGGQTTTCWQFVNSCLLHARVLRDDRVCSMLLSHSALLQDIGKYLNEDTTQLQHIHVYTLAMVLDQIQVFNIKAESVTLCLPFEKLSRPILLAENHLTTCCSLQFWLAYFTGHAKTVEIQDGGQNDLKDEVMKTKEGDVETTEMKSEKATENKQVPSEAQNEPHAVNIKWKRSEHSVQTGSQFIGGLSDKEIRVIYAYLQQCIMKEQALTMNLATLCVDRLLTFSKVNKALYGHLKNQHWMCMVISVLYSTHNVHDISYSTSTLLTFSAVLLKHGIKYIQPYMKILQQTLSVTPTSSHVHLAVVNCMQQIITNSISPLEPELKKSLGGILDSLQRSDQSLNNEKWKYKSIEEQFYMDFTRLYPNISL